MKKLRYLNLGIVIVLSLSFSVPSAIVFAKTQVESETKIGTGVLKEEPKLTEVKSTELEIEVEEAKVDAGAGKEEASAEKEEKVGIEKEEKTSAEKEEKAKTEPDYEETEILMSASVSEEGTLMPNVVIYSYNPGFSDPYVGEFVELRNLRDNSISLAGLSIIYETSSGSEYVVLEFSKEYEMTGESLLFRLASSEEVKNAEDAMLVSDMTYTRNMAQSAGRIKLNYNDETIDSLCWGLKEAGCYTKFKTGKKNPPTTLVRLITEDEIGDFIFSDEYIPSYNPLSPGLLIREIPEEIIEPQCRALEFTEIFTYYETSANEQFVEIFNNSDEEVKLDGCFISYKGKNHALTGFVGARKILAIYPFAEWNLTMTKNPTSVNKLSLIDTDGEIVDSLSYYSGQRKGVSFARITQDDGVAGWMQTYSVTAGTANVFQKFKACPAGKVINLETGNCVNEVQPVVTLAACPEGKYRNPLTGRCRSIETTTATLKPCAEGYERNPETNRCRKIVENTGADYPVATGTFEEKKEMASVYAIATIIVAGLGYIGFQYKDELKTRLSSMRR